MVLKPQIKGKNHLNRPYYYRSEPAYHYFLKAFYSILQKVKVNISEGISTGLEPTQLFNASILILQFCKYSQSIVWGNNKNFEHRIGYVTAYLQKDHWIRKKIHFLYESASSEDCTADETNLE